MTQSIEALNQYTRNLSREIDRCVQTGFSEGVFDDEGFNLWSLELFRIQAVSNPVYQRLLSFWKTEINSIDRWEKIPTVPTVAFKEQEVTSLPEEQRPFVFRSSGTTAADRGRHFHDPISLGLYEMSLTGWFARHVLTDSTVSRGEILSLTPPPSLVPESSLVHMFAVGSNATTTFIGDVDEKGAWILPMPAVHRALEKACETQRPVTLLGTAFNFVQLVDQLEADGRRWQLPPGSGALETGGYKGRTRELTKTELYARIHDSLGISSEHVVSEYGMSELSSQAYDWRLGRATEGEGERCFHFPPWARVRVISPETNAVVSEGETGLIQVFDLANVWSVMALQTEDLGRAFAGGFALLGRAAEAEPKGCSLLPDD